MALSADRNIPRTDGVERPFPVAASTEIFAGALVVNDAGVAKPGATDTGLVSLGVAQEHVDNSAGQDGDKVVRVRRGIFRFANSADTDEITAADVGATCYIVDDETVAKTDDESARSAAGIVWAVDSQGVWVSVG